ncbi:hypothetical protein PFLUV_G00008110 [Perca fluviatilis]|uniref:exo-alpha-sialidase n=1 Tax=Perca fluviatilis TaxID=8168 RepID=A0A6A5FHH4_PERFL|nr:hypothetical protein PFLUV_G00008110 [Perca fluviatilis]
MANKPSRQYELVEEEKTVFKSNEQEVYRIPALFYDRHHKLLMAFAEKRRTSDDASGLTLFLKSGTINQDETTHEVTVEWSERISEPVKARLDGYRPMNPCLVYEKTSKKLFLFFIYVEGTVSEQQQIASGRNKARLCYVTTDDVGQSWSDVTDLTESLVDIQHWATFAVGPGHGLQTESGNSLIYCNARNKGGYREEAVSKNSGEDFTKLGRNLVETGGGCQGSVVSFPAQSECTNQSQSPNKWLLFSHPSDKSKRVNLGVYLNTSPGSSNAWSKPYIIHSGPSGYSDLAYIDDGWFACLMECGKRCETEQIAVKFFDYKDVKQGIGE